MTTFRELMSQQPCDYCGAKPGEPCLTKTKQRVYMFHASRYYQAKKVLSRE